MFMVGDIGWNRLAKKKLEDFDFTGNEVLKLIINDRIYSEKWDKGIGLYGNVGVGKTHLLVLLYKNRVWWSVNTRGLLPFPRWISFYELSMDVKKHGFEIVEAAIGDSSLIFIDDFLMKCFDWEIEKKIASMIIMKSYDYEKKLCFTSNFNVDELDVDRRIVDRLHEMCDLVEVFGKSKREEEAWAKNLI
jgi:DNA replication protein DnaC